MCELLRNHSRDRRHYPSRTLLLMSLRVSHRGPAVRVEGRAATCPGNVTATFGGWKGVLTVRRATSRLLCETTIAPDGGVVVIEDAGTTGVSGTYVHAEIVPAPDDVHRALWVHTMNFHECDIVGRRVYVRVLSGEDTGGLGVLAFDGYLNIASGLLAIGERRNPNRQLLVGPPGVIRVSVFVANDIDAVCFDDSGVSYPMSGPSEITLLLHGASWHTRAINSARRRRISWWRGRAGVLPGPTAVVS